MRRLDLNFQQQPDRPSSVAGWLLLIVGVVLLIEMGLSYGRLQHERAAINDEIRSSRLQVDTSRRETATPQFMEKDFDEARQIIKRLSSPWKEIFAGLESVNSKNVAILVIQPDMQTGLLRIEGEAKDYAAALTLVAQLRTTKPFSEVFLSHHEIKRDDPQHPVVFTVSMRWVKPS
jgi:hypothetical protein